MSDGADAFGREKELQKENLRLSRRVRQLERMTRNSEVVAAQSQGAFRRTVEDLRQRTKELEEATKQAEAAVVAKDLFLATMSHEIRTPMNGVIGCIELIEQEDLSDPQKEVVGTLQSSARLLMLLLNDVLDFAKLQSGRVTLESTPFEIDGLLQEINALHAMGAARRGVSVEAEIDGALQSQVLGDQYRLRQVLNNLISNAVKFTEVGSVVLRARPGSAPDHVCFEVEDSGIGMGTDVLQKIFDPFRQADDTTTRRFGGTGLGLAICKSLVEAMGGDLQVHSEVDVGSRFSFEIKLAATGSNTADPSVPRADAGSKEPGLALSVLLVDDNPVNRLVGSKILRKIGCAVTTASGGEEAVQRASETHYDAIFMDCSMPDVDGYEATGRIRSLEAPRSSVPIFALTAFAMPGDREKSLAAGMDEHLTKPLQVDALKAVLGTIKTCRRAA